MSLARFDPDSGEIWIGDLCVEFEDAVWLLETKMEEVIASLGMDTRPDALLAELAHLVTAVFDLMEWDDDSSGINSR